MRFRLRTLLIVITAAGVLFARTGYLMQRARFHRREAKQIAYKIATVENDEAADVEQAIHLLAKGHSAPPNTTLLNGRGVALFGYEFHSRTVASESWLDWQLAIWHGKMAYEYDQDVFRLWPGEKPDPPDKIYPLPPFSN